MKRGARGRSRPLRPVLRPRPRGSSRRVRRGRSGPGRATPIPCSSSSLGWRAGRGIERRRGRRGRPGISSLGWRVAEDLAGAEGASRACEESQGKPRRLLGQCGRTPGCQWWRTWLSGMWPPAGCGSRFYFPNTGSSVRSRPPRPAASQRHKGLPARSGVIGATGADPARGLC